MSAKLFRFSEFELDVPKRLLLRDGEPVPLSPKTLDLLVVLLESRGEVVSKDTLLEKVWPDQIIEEGNLKVHISALRKAFQQVGNDHRFIVTVPGRGYSFVADLENFSNDEVVVETHRYSTIVTEQSESLDDGDLDARQLIAQPASPLITQRRAVIFGLSILVIAAGLVIWLYPRSAPVSPVLIETIAVMPFVNESGNPDLEYLSDGMTESLINSLSKLPRLSVKARSVVFRYKGKEVVPSEVGSDLNVQAVLLGRVVERGDRLTLYLSLVDARTGDQIWGDQYDRQTRDVVSLQSETARDIARKLRSKLSGVDEAKMAKNYTEDAEAYQHYLKGRYFWNKFTPGDHLIAIDHFNRAIARDPGYAMAYSALGDAYGASGVNSWIPPKEAFAKAKTAVRKALEIDGDLAHAHTTLGALYLFSDFNWNAAEQELKRSIELDSNYELAHEIYSYLLTGLRRHDEAIAEARRACALDPLSSTLSDDLALAYNFARRPDEAMKQNLRTLEMEPDRPDSIYRIGTIYEQKGMYDEAVASYQKAISVSERTSNFLGSLGHAYAASGRKEEAAKILNELKDMSKHSYVSPYDLALIYIGLGEKEKAVEQLERTYDEQSGWIIYLQVDPFLDPLRGDRRFQKLVDRSGL